MKSSDQKIAVFFVRGDACRHFCADSFYAAILFYRCFDLPLKTALRTELRADPHNKGNPGHRKLNPAIYHRIYSRLHHICHSGKLFLHMSGIADCLHTRNLFFQSWQNALYTVKNAFCSSYLTSDFVVIISQTK